jgi:hypothetical protein
MSFRIKARLSLHCTRAPAQGTDLISVHGHDTEPPFILEFPITICQKLSSMQQQHKYAVFTIDSAMNILSLNTLSST